MTAAALQSFRGRVQAQMETFFPATIVIGNSPPIECARGAISQSATSELAGLLGTYDAVYRVRRELLTGITITPERTTLLDSGKRYRVEKMLNVEDTTDTGLVLACKNA